MMTITVAIITRCASTGESTVFPFKAMAAGKVSGDELVLGAKKLEGLGVDGVSVCVRDPDCGS